MVRSKVVEGYYNGERENICVRSDGGRKHLLLLVPERQSDLNTDSAVFYVCV